MLIGERAIYGIRCTTYPLASTHNSYSGFFNASSWLLGTCVFTELIYSMSPLKSDVPLFQLHTFYANM